jgi:hypothetical protein
MSSNRKDPDIKTLTVLGLLVVIPILLLLTRWGQMPASAPPSKNLLFSFSNY